MKQLHVDRTDRIAMSKVGKLILRNVIAVALFMLAWSQAEAQEMIVSIDAFQEQTVPGAQGRTMMAARTTSNDLDAEKVEIFRNLYYQVQPALYYDQDETLDVRNGELPTVITVHPAAFQRLQGDLQNSRYDFSVVKLIVVKDIRAGGGLRKFLLDTSKDNFPSLDYVVVANNKDTGEMNENTVRSMTQAVDAGAESLAHLIFVYDNLTENN